jgi:hypothetical protein
MPIQSSERVLTTVGTSDPIRLSKDVDHYEVSILVHFGADNVDAVATVEASMDAAQSLELWGQFGSPAGKWFPIADAVGLVDNMQRKLDGLLFSALRVKKLSGTGTVSLIANQLRKGS